MKWFTGAGLVVMCVGVARAQEPPTPVPGVPYQRWEELDADGFGRSIKFRNDYSKPITITDIVLNRCDNTRQSCGTHQLDKVVQPGKTITAYRVERLVPSRSWSYNWTLHTKMDPVVTVGPPPGAQPSITAYPPGGGPGVPVQPIKVDEFHALVPAETGGATCGKVRAPDLPEGHKALLMVFGTADDPVMRRVTVRYNGSGIAYDYVDIRRGTGDAKDAQTQIQLDLVRETALLRNTPGGGKPPEMFRVTGSGLVNAESLGKPGDLIERIRKECDKQ